MSIIRVLLRGRVSTVQGMEGEVMMEEKVQREGFEDSKSLALETEEAHPQENGWPPEAAKVRQQSLLEIPEGTQP